MGADVLKGRTSQYPMGQSDESCRTSVEVLTTCVSEVLTPNSKGVENPAR